MTLNLVISEKIADVFMMVSFRRLSKLMVTSSSGEKFPNLVLSLVEACANTLKHFQEINCINSIAPLMPLFGSRILRVLEISNLSFSEEEELFL